jgi:hypothetical protein
MMLASTALYSQTLSEKIAVYGCESRDVVICNAGLLNMFPSVDAVVTQHERSSKRRTLR